MKKAVIYARVSTDEQAEHGTSLQSQLETCRDYAEENNLDVIEEFLDDYTGTTLDQPGLNELQDALDKEKAGAVIVLNTDRLSRNFHNSVHLITIWADKEIELHFTDSGKEKISSNSMILGAVKQILAHEEINTLVRRSRNGKINKIRIKGKPVLVGPVPYGYRKEGGGYNAEYKIYEPEAEIVRIMFKLYLSGNGRCKPLSLRGIANFLKESKISTPASRPNYQAQRWRASTIRDILKNELYNGVYCYGKTRAIRKGYQQKGTITPQPKEQWMRLDLPHLSIVDSNIWEAAQTRLEYNKRFKGKTTPKKFLLSGHFTCAYCGYAYAGQTKKRSGGGNNNYYRHRLHDRNSECKYNRINLIKKEVAEGLVWEWIVNLLTDVNYLEKGLQELINSNETKHLNLEEQANKLDGTLNQIRDEIQTYINELPHHKSDLAIQAFRKKIDEKTNSYKALEQEQNSIRLQLKQISVSQEQKDLIQNFANQIAKNINKATFDDKRFILDLLRVEVKFFEDKEGNFLSIQCGIPSEDMDIMLGKPGSTANTQS